MGQFLWKFSGKIFRIALDEIKNAKLAGGLNLPCLASMADSLLASQCIRMIRSGDMESLGHLAFWLGDLLGDCSLDGSGGQGCGYIRVFWISWTGDG